MLTLSKNPAVRRPSSQTPRQPYRGLHPTHQAQDSDTLSQSHNRHTAYGATKSLRPIPMGRQPCRHRRQREGRRVGKDGSTERTRLRTALRVQQHAPGPPEAGYHRAEVGRGMLMDGVMLEQAPRVPTTEEDAARRRPKLAKRWPCASTSSGRARPRPRRSASAPATPVGGATTSREHLQELQEVEIPNIGHPVGRGPAEDQEADRAGPNIRALC